MAGNRVMKKNNDLTDEQITLTKMTKLSHNLETKLANNIAEISSNKSDQKKIINDLSTIFGESVIKLRDLLRNEGDVYTVSEIENLFDREMKTIQNKTFNLIYDKYKLSDRVNAVPITLAATAAAWGNVALMTKLTTIIVSPIVSGLSVGGVMAALATSVAIDVLENRRKVRSARDHSKVFVVNMSAQLNIPQIKFNLKSVPKK